MDASVEENYVKAIYRLTEKNPNGGYTNDIAIELNIKAASVSEALRKLADKQLISYTKYKPVHLTDKGREMALKTIRKHRLWEVFLVEKLGYKWDEIHAIAEELEHIHFDDLTERLAIFLGNPKFDPHGDAIPDKNGRIAVIKSSKLTTVNVGKSVTMTGIENDSSSFLQHLDRLGLKLGSKMVIREKVEFDNSLLLEVDDNRQFFVSYEVALNILCK